MAFPYLVVGAIGVPVTDTIWANGDRTTSQWEDEGGATTNLWQSVDSESDTDYVTLQIIILNDTRTLAFNMETPSGEPIGSQTVEVQVRARYLEPGVSLPTAPEITIDLDESTTLRAAGSATSLTTAFADYSLFLNQTQINSVTDWADVEVEMLFDNTMNTGVDEEANFEVSECRVIFSP